MEPKKSILLLIFLSIVSASLTFLIPYFYTISLQLAIFFIGAYFLFKKNVKTTLDSIGVRDHGKNVVLGVQLFVAMIVVTLVMVNLLVLIFGIDDAGRIKDTLNGLPLYVILAAVVLAPFTEEVFFRAFLAGRFGIIASSFVFCAFHLAYGSVVEIVGTFVIGAMLAYAYKKGGSIIPCVTAHFLYNLVSIYTVIA
ncbi:MAG: CPBP family intramembrane glutamic endopeptidase [Candidatus Bilamarchaeaceae archaeon]